MCNQIGAYAMGPIFMPELYDCVLDGREKKNAMVIEIQGWNRFKE